MSNADLEVAQRKALQVGRARFRTIADVSCDIEVSKFVFLYLYSLIGIGWLAICFSKRHNRRSLLHRTTERPPLRFAGDSGHVR